MPASPNVGNYKFPFKHIPDISSDASRQIRRNFEALFNIPSNSQFDAIIDPLLATSDAVNHRYKNLSDLVLAETWAVTHTFKVGVKTQANVAIVDSLAPGSNDIRGRGDLALFGLGGPLVNASHACWAWSTITADIGQQVYLYNLSLGGFFSGTIQSGGQCFVESCFFTSALSSPIASGVATNLLAHNCYIDGSWFFQSGNAQAQTVELYGCHITGSLGVSNLVTATVQGGSIGYGGSATITVSGSGAAYISASIQASLTISTAGPAATVVVNTGQIGGTVNVTSTIPSVVVEGDWGTVTFSGVSTAMRRFAGSSDSMDFRGPGQLITTNKSAAFGNTVVLRGKAVHAVVSVVDAVGIAGVSLTDSQIVADFATPRVFSLDAASARCVAILSGTHQASWGGTTNLGTNNRIITETDDTLVNYILSIFNSGGFRGQPGVDGEDGMDGFPGPPGLAGTPGAAGLQGKPVDGLDGEDGFDGYPGPPGPTGATGPQGPVGRQGMDGIDGEDGLDGVPGPPGLAPTGSIVMYGGAAAPAGWLLCQGQSLLRTDYGALFAVFGTTYGSVDGTHFTLPDLQEKFPLGKGGTHALGATGGATTHSHTFTTAGWANIAVDGTTTMFMNQIVTPNYPETNHFTTAAQTAAATTRAIGSTLGGATGPTTGPIDPFVTVNYIVKV